jgi:hypothetical protein
MRFLLALVILCAISLTIIDGLRVHKKLNDKNKIKSKSIPPFKTFYMEQYLDHFNFKDDRTFQMRYLVNGKFL